MLGGNKQILHGREATKKCEKGTLGASAVLAGVQGTPEKLTRVKMKKLLFTTLAFGLLPNGSALVHLVSR